MTMPGTGELQQLVPEEEQITDGEPQLQTRPGSPLVHLEEEEKRTKPTPTAPRPSLPSEEEVEDAETIQAIYGTPVLRWNRLTDTKKEFQELLRWDIPVGYTGDLHEIALKSSSDSKTRWKIVIAGVDQDVPTDRQLTTPVNFPFQRGVLPGGTSIYVAFMSSDGTSITVDGTITGSVR